MNDVTRILSAIDWGDPQASEQLLPLVYDELRRLAAQRLAHEKPGQTLQATALVHEAFLRLVDTEKVQRWNSRGHFFAAAAEAMRRILINRARDKLRHKRGGGWKRIDLDRVTVADRAADEAIQQLQADKPHLAQIAMLRYFAGLSADETAAVLGVSASTLTREWRFARAWLVRRLGSEDKVIR
jgi:RNA polymerase sigma factor (TIGR02999 family)